MGRRRETADGKGYDAINISALPMMTIIAVNNLRKEHSHVYVHPWGERYVLKTISYPPGSPEFNAMEADLSSKGYMLVIGSSQPIMPRVELRFWDRDQHDLDCTCGDCDSVTHISYGVGVFPYRKDPLYDGELDDPIHTEYSPSEWAAFYNAKLWCAQEGYAITREVS